MNFIKESGITSSRTLLEDDLTSQSHSCWCQQLGSALLEVVFLQLSRAISCVFPKAFLDEYLRQLQLVVKWFPIYSCFVTFEKDQHINGNDWASTKISNSGFYWLGMIVLCISVRFSVHLNLLKAPPRLAAILAAEVGILNVHVFFSCLSTSTNFLSLNRFHFCLQMLVVCAGLLKLWNPELNTLRAIHQMGAQTFGTKKIPLSSFHSNQVTLIGHKVIASYPDPK
jgi:hypothetical protein